jgi:ATP-dependent Clp protease ATP-binding subunit ClpX
MPLRTSKLHCSFCGKSQSEVKNLIAGPSAYICGECATALAHPENVASVEARKEKCSFCGKQAREVDIVLGNERVQICNECLEVCQEIISVD